VHYIGLFLKKIYPHLSWIVHASDPIANNPYENLGFFSSRYRIFLEKRIVRKADLVITTTPQYKKNLSINSPHFPLHKIVFIPGVVQSLSMKQKVNSKYFRIVHTGNLYGLRNLEQFENAINWIKENSPDVLMWMQFSLVGDLSSRNHKTALRVGKLVQTNIVSSRISHVETEDFCLNADLLLTIEAPLDNNPFFPSKILDYLAYPSPQLLISRSGFLVDYLQDKQGFHVDSGEDSEALGLLILRLYNLWLSGSLDSPTSEVYKFFSPIRIKRLFQEALEGM
jgi:hypothetical protein